MGLKQGWSREVQGHSPALKPFSFATGHITRWGGLGQELPQGQRQGGLGDSHHQVVDFSPPSTSAASHFSQGWVFRESEDRNKLVRAGSSAKGPTM